VLQPLQPRDLLALFGDDLLQRRHLAEQFQHQVFQLKMNEAGRKRTLHLNPGYPYVI